MNLAKLSISRPTFISALIGIVLIVGTIFMFRLPVDMFPDVNFPFVMVTTIYPGAGPQEMETLVSKKLEDQISSISGLKSVWSINNDGVSIVYGEFALETKPEYAEQQIKDKVAQAKNLLPKDINEPIIKRFDPSDRPILIASLTAELSPTELYDLADITIKKAVEQVPNVSLVELIGGTKREIHVDLDPRKLKDFDTSVTMVAGQITANSQDIPIGKVNKEPMELSFRSLGEFRSLQQIENVIVSFFGNDIPTLVSQLGKVSDASEDQKTKGRLNGKSALLINIYKQSDSNTVLVSQGLEKKIKQINKDLANAKGSPKVVSIRDQARPIKMNLDDVKVTIIEGFLLTILVVYLFLGNFRSTFITVIALPNSLIGAFIFMGLAGFSINMLTLMAMSLAVGLLIDDAIVVRENIFRHLENGEEPKTAALKGTNEVQLAVIATTLTVVAVFLPVGFLQGTVGQFFKEFGLTIVFAMFISLFDALTTAPMLSAYLIGSVNKNISYKGFRYIAHAPANAFDKFQKWLEQKYEKVMRLTFKHRLSVIITSLLIFLLSLALVMKIPKTFMPKNEWGEFMIGLEAAPGTSLNQMEKYSIEVEDALLKEKDIDTVLSTIGDPNGNSAKAMLFVKMVPEKYRKRTTGLMKEHLRSLLSNYKSKFFTEVGDLSMGGEDYPFELFIFCDDLCALDVVAQGLIEKFTKIPGLVDLKSSYKGGKPEFQIKMDSRKMELLGIQSLPVGMELRAMVEGILPAKYRENGNEYDIRVRLAEPFRDLSTRFNSIFVPNINRQLVKLENIAVPLQTSGPTQITRRNRSRYITITGNLDQKGAIADITAEARKILAKEKLPSYIKYEFLGATEDFEDLFKNMLIAAGLSIIFIYFCLASLYESLIVPFTIMTALPLAIVGGLIALFITGQSINMFTMIGFIMLLGLVTKNSILLVDFTQRLMRNGYARDEAIVKAGLTRLRPILMTTFALIAGMTPLALALTEVGKFRQSMGITIIGGLISSTFLTLVLIPSIFGYMDDFRMWCRKLFGRPKLREFDKIIDTDITIDK